MSCSALSVDFPTINRRAARADSSMLWLASPTLHVMEKWLGLKWVRQIDQVVAKLAML